MDVAPLFRFTGSTNPKLKLKKIWTSYSALRQGSSFEMKLHLRAQDCLLPLEAEGEPALRRLALQIAAPPGMEAQLVGRSFDKIDCSPAEGEWTAHNLVLTLGVTATSKAALGKHELSALLSCDTILLDGDRLPQKLSLKFPLKVVAAHEPVKVQSNAGAMARWRVLLSPARLMNVLFWDGS